MIKLCVVKTEKRKYVITTTEIKHKYLEYHEPTPHEKRLAELCPEQRQAYLQQLGYQAQYQHQFYGSILGNIFGNQLGRLL